MKRYRFIDGFLNCEVYIPKNSNNKCAIYLYGFPGSVGTNAVIELLCGQGYTIFSPNYYGTYDSGGVHTPLSALQTALDLISVITQGEFTDIKSFRKINFSPVIEVIAATSFGCFIALRATQFLPSIKSLLLIAPVITFCNSGENYCGIVEDGIENLEYVRRSRPHTYRLGSQEEWSLLFNGHYDLPDPVKPILIEHIIGIIGEEDKTFDVPILQKNFKKLIERVTAMPTSSELITVPHGSHSADSLLTEELIKTIKNKI